MNRVTESNSVMMDAWDVMNHGSPDFEKQRGGLIEASWSGYPIIFFNFAVTARKPKALSEFEEAAVAFSEWAGGKGVPWMFAVCHGLMGDSMPGIEQSMVRLGFAPMMPMTGMDAEEIAPPARVRPKAAWFTEQSEGIGGMMLRLNEAAYNSPLGEPGTLNSEQPGWWRAPGRMATVCAPEGNPASCAAVFDVGGIRYVAYVATLPAEQRKGYAEAAMRDVLERALAAGMKKRTILHATGAGRPVYERMGYQVMAEYTVFARRAFLEGGH